MYVKEKSHRLVEVRKKHSLQLPFAEVVTHDSGGESGALVCIDKKVDQRDCGADRRHSLLQQQLCLERKLPP